MHSHIRTPAQNINTHTHIYTAKGILSKELAEAPLWVYGAQVCTRTIL